MALMEFALEISRAWINQTVGSRLVLNQRSHDIILLLLEN